MNPFQITENHSCNRCGKLIKTGDTVYAANADRVRNGGAICQACFDAANKPVEPEKPGKANKPAGAEK